MQALDLLLHRSSQPRLQAPAPQGEQLQRIIKAASRAPDHRSLSPWKFIVCEGEGLDKLGQIFEQAAIEKGAEQSVIERATQLPKRAPMVIVGICKYQEHDGVPVIEQIASTACAIHAMQLAINAQGFDCIWRTGSYAQDETVKRALDLRIEDEILAFLYVGSSPLKPGMKPVKCMKKHVEYWQ